MSPIARTRCGMVVGLTLLLATAQVAAADRAKTLLQQAELFEKQNDWERACDAYENLLRISREPAEVRSRYVQCLRRSWQARRHHDLSYRKEVLTLDYAQALRLFSTVRDALLDHSLERKKVSPAVFFRKGLEELDAALADPFFCQQYLPGVKEADVQAFRVQMSRTWGDAKPATRQEVTRQIREVAMTAQSTLQLSSTVAVMEFACGGCYALDEYTVYLTPAQLRELLQSLKGETVGVGLTLLEQGGKILFQDIAGAAAEIKPPLMKFDQLVGIDKKAVGHLPVDAVRELLEGPAGTSVELEIVTMMGTRAVTLRRQPVFLPSVTAFPKTDAVGYLRISAFQDSTPQELDNALAILSSSGIKALVLDLRGNNGGVFDASIESARRFLSSGIIASTRHQDPKFNTVYSARNASSFTLPMVVLIDADTASAAEVLAGALKDNGRARILGQTSFGKGCTQCVLKLPPASGGLPTGGLRLTIARFYSPKGESYTGRGVIPDLIVDRGILDDSMMTNFDAQLDAAVAELERTLVMHR